MAILAKIDPLLCLGLLGQGLFTMRFLVQWLASERAGRSVTPIAFWYFSLGGGAMLLLYAAEHHDPVFVLGQAMGLVIYLRNLLLIARDPQRQRETTARPKAGAAGR